VENSLSADWLALGLGFAAGLNGFLVLARSGDAWIAGCGVPGQLLMAVR
jgi:hypothetical protein